MYETTVELPDALLREAKRVALRERTTVRALIERGLRAVVSSYGPRGRFTLRRASFRGATPSTQVRSGLVARE